MEIIREFKAYERNEDDSQSLHGTSEKLPRNRFSECEEFLSRLFDEGLYLLCGFITCRIGRIFRRHERCGDYYLSVRHLVDP